MKVLICSRKDFANVGYEMSQALESVGACAKSLVLYKHKLGYDRQGDLSSWREIMSLAKEYDVIQFMHSGRDFLFRASSERGGVRDDKRLSLAIRKLADMNKKMIVFHGGTIYRQCNTSVNRIVNPLVSASIIQTPDLLALGAKNEVWIPAPINMSTFSGKRKSIDMKKLVFGHFPSDPKVKGSHMIREVMREFQESKYKDKFLFITDDKIVKHSENLSRVDLCDIYIEHQGFEQLGKRYGACGVAALEAAALNKVVITSNAQEDVYKKRNTTFGLLASNSKEQLRSKVEHILSLSQDQILRLQNDHKDWVYKNFSYKKIGADLIKLYGEVA